MARNRRPRKRDTKESDYDSKPTKQDMESKGANDISWYAQDAQLLSDSASLPWSTQTGIVYSDDIKFAIGSDLFTDVKKESIPGILSMRLLTGPGKTKIDLDAANVSANAIYTFIRHLNSGHANYDAPDLMYYLLQMDDIFSMINWLQRVYGTIFAYNIFNRYTPKALLRAQSIDPDSVLNNIVGFRTRLNMIIKQAATLVVPNNLPIYFRHSWLFQNYYIEGTDIKDQIYMYVPSTFRVLDTTSQPAQLVPMQFTNTAGQSEYFMNDDDTYDVFELLDRLQEMVSQLYLSEDFGIMAGDILKAYGEGNIMRLSEIPEAYVTPILPNNEVLLQFKNSIILESAYSMVHSNLVWDQIFTDAQTNSIVWNTTVPSAASAAFADAKKDVVLNGVRLLTMEGAPSPAMNMIMTRNMPYVEYDFDEVPAAPGAIIYAGTEIPVSMAAWHFRDRNGNSEIENWGFVTLLSADTSSPYIKSIWLKSLAILSNFKYHPQIYTLVYDTSDLSYDLQRVFQVDNFTFIKNSELDRMHAVAIMSEFNIPTMALVK